MQSQMSSDSIVGVTRASSLRSRIQGVQTYFLIDVDVDFTIFARVIYTKQ